jgi:hypothetical protein
MSCFDVLPFIAPVAGFLLVLLVLLLLIHVFIRRATCAAYACAEQCCAVHSHERASLFSLGFVSMPTKPIQV